MKFKLFLAVGAVGVGLVMPQSASALYGPQAVRQIKQAVERDCHSYPGYRCVHWEVWHCYKLSHRKVRCRALQEYMHNGNWRECKFNAAAVQEKHSAWVHIHFGPTRCYSESGEPI